MNKYDIKVGDYVETWDEDIGYVTDVGSDCFYIKLIINKEKEEYPPDNKSYYDLKNEKTIPRDFRRIGTNIFTKKRNKFEPISNLDICYATGNELARKLNELIGHVNAIQERLNEYDGTRTD